MVIVPPAGPTPSDLLFIGEAPGEIESRRGLPFVGPSGHELSSILHSHHLNLTSYRRANTIPEYLPGNPDPTPELITKYTPALLQEVHTCNPRIIIAVGRFAARWFLGDYADMELCHGIPHYAGAFDPSRINRAPTSTVIIPVLHPATVFKGSDDKRNESRSIINWDIGRVADAYKSIKAGNRISPKIDEHAGREQYLDLTGHDFSCYLSVSPTDEIAIDTEGTPSSPWSIQVSAQPGSGYVLRYSQPDFHIGIQYLQYIIDRGILIILHNGMYDIEMCRNMGLDLRRARLYDTMYAAYTLRIEPQGLKPLSWRWAGMRMQSYEDTIGQTSIDRQLSYLHEVLRNEWPKSEPTLIYKNDGTYKQTTPWDIKRKVEKILEDYYSSVPLSTADENSENIYDDSEDTDNELDSLPIANPEDTIPVNLLKRWNAIDKITGGVAYNHRSQRKLVENRLGPFPIATLADIPLPSAISYSCRDSDATLRVKQSISIETERMGTSTTVARGMAALPMFEAMQSHGMPASRSYFLSLRDEMQQYLSTIGTRISTRYFSGRPFNPKSPIQVRTLMRRRGLTGTEKTKTGEISTGKKSIEHLRYTDEAMADMLDWREHQHIRDSYCRALLNYMPTVEDSPSTDIHYIRCQLKTTRTATRRLASTRPNLLAIPSRTELGLRVRHGFVAPPGMLFGACDFSGIEMRCMAHESRDPFMCRLFREGRDLHSETAALIFGKDLSQVDIKSNDWKMNYRYPAKTVGFGVLYGLQSEGLQTQLWKEGLTTWTKADCEHMIKEWFSVYKGVRQYILSTTEEVRRAPYNIVRDHSGMIRYLPGIKSESSSIAAEAGRMAVSHRIQGLAQDMIQVAMGYLWEMICDLQDSGHVIYPALQVHDELVHLFNEEEEYILRPIVEDSLVNHCGIRLRVPVEVEWHSATTWGGVK